MQFSSPFLKLVELPLNLGKVSLGVCLKHSYSLQEISDFDLLRKLAIASLKHTVYSAFFTAAGYESLDIQSQRTEQAPMDVLILLDTLLHL